MQWIVLSIIFVVTLAFCGAVYVAFRNWRKAGPGRRIAGLLFLVPHLLLLICIAISSSVGKAPQGSPRFNEGFFTSVLIVFILPVPAALGTITSLSLFLTARPR